MMTCTMQKRTGFGLYRFLATGPGLYIPITKKQTCMNIRSAMRTAVQIYHRTNTASIGSCTRVAVMHDGEHVAAVEEAQS